MISSLQQLHRNIDPVFILKVGLGAVFHNMTYIPQFEKWGIAQDDIEIVRSHSVTCWEGLPSYGRFFLRKLKKSNWSAQVRSFLNAVVSIWVISPGKMTSVFCLLWESLVCKANYFFRLISFLFLQVNIFHEHLIRRNQKANEGIWLYRLWCCHQRIYAKCIFFMHPRTTPFIFLSPMDSFCWLQRMIWPQRKLLIRWNKRKKELYQPRRTLLSPQGMCVCCSKSLIQILSPVWNWAM